MKLIKAEDDLLEFDNGLKITGEGDNDCCAINWIDFANFTTGAEYPDMTLGEFIDKVKIKEDGFILKDSQGTPKWAQARTSQNGYYSPMTTLFAEQDGKRVELGRVAGEDSEDSY